MSNKTPHGITGKTPDWAICAISEAKPGNSTNNSHKFLFSNRKSFCLWSSPPNRILLWTFPACSFHGKGWNSCCWMCFSVIPGEFPTNRGEGIQHRESQGSGCSIMGWRPRLRATALLQEWGVGQMEPLEINLLPPWPMSTPALPHKSNPQPGKEVPETFCRFLGKGKLLQMDRPRETGKS